jgi:hypothetical protein
MHKQRILGSGIILGTILVLSLVATGVMRHRESAQGSGVGLLWTDVTLLVAYGSAGILVWKQSPRHDPCDNGWGADRPAGWCCSDRESPD